MKPIVIYTDLDGSLLNHDDYSHQAADTLLEALKADDIPVIPCTSKTRSELIPFRAELSNTHPFIVENGAAAFLPKSRFPDQPEGTSEQDGFWVKSFVEPHAHWLALIDSIAASFAGMFTSFSRMSTEAIIELTGLTKAAAERAAQREYGEPVHWTGSSEDKQAFIDALTERGAKVLQGGRFMHVSGACDKGKALLWLHRFYQQRHGAQKLFSLALGDSQNDVAMLDAADFAVVIRSPAHAPPTLQREQDFMISTQQGPSGWCEGVQQYLQQIE